MKDGFDVILRFKAISEDCNGLKNLNRIISLVYEYSHVKWHTGVHISYKSLKAMFYWPYMKALVRKFMEEYDVHALASQKRKGIIF